jgi:hypothetical protein
MKLTQAGRKWLLTLHILFASIMFGVMVAFIILSITAAGTKDEGILTACYSSMLLLAGTSVRASTIGTVITGVALSLFTHWGFVRYYWIIAKEMLTAVTIVLGVGSIYIWTLRAFEAADRLGASALLDMNFQVNRLFLFWGIGAQVVSLAALFALSVFKPWGRRAKLR